MTKTILRNSFSAHSIIILPEDVMREWAEPSDGVTKYLFEDINYNFDKLPPDQRPEKNVLYTLNEVLSFARNAHIHIYEIADFNEESEYNAYMSELLEDLDCYSFSSWAGNLETDLKYFTTETGNTIGVYSRYGYDC